MPPEPTKILAVEDDPEMLSLLEDYLGAEGCSVIAVREGPEALRRLQAEPFDLVLTDLRLPGVDGMEVLRSAREHMPDVPVILITAFGSIENAIQAIRQGAYDYVTKPFSMEEIGLLVRKALDHRRLRAENVRLRQELEGRYRFANLLGKSPAMQAVFELIRRVAGGESNVLITGETGTGKELVARAIHFNSSRGRGPFVPVNCAAIPEGLLESELFGHVKGAFTGAATTRRGLFLEAAGGTLFPDEIAAMSPALQAKVLRAIQDREVRPVGRDEASPVDLRLLAASNRDVRAMVTAGEFREDLYYRLAVIPIQLPPLRERAEDIPLLAEAFLRKYTAAIGRPIRGFSPEAMARLLVHPWPGNVRELENVVERAVNLCTQETIAAADLGLEAGVADTGFSLKRLGPRPTLQELVDAYTAATLEQLKSDKDQVAAILGISKRTLYRWLRKHGLAEDKPSQSTTT